MRSKAAFCIPFALSAALSLPVMAAEFVYADFEAAVQHLDLDACPAGLVEMPAFCRVTLGHDSVHVFAFAEEGDHRFLLVRTYYDGEFTLTVGD